jgi:hypothetical protein
VCVKRGCWHLAHGVEGAWLVHENIPGGGRLMQKCVLRGMECFVEIRWVVAMRWESAAFASCSFSLESAAAHDATV